jgi:YD repeat-containing protein
MTDLETVLRSQLHDRLDDLEPSPMTAQRAVMRGHRVQRRRTAVVAVTAAVTLLAGAATGAALLPGGSDGGESVAASTLLDRTAAYAGQFRTRDFASIRLDMTPSTRSVLSEALLRSGWQQTVDAYGPATGVGPAVVETGRVVTVRVPVHFKRGDANLRVTYDASGRIIGVTLLTANVSALPAAPSALEATARRVVDELVNGHFDIVRARFDATMTRGLSTAQLRSAWQQVAVDKHGGFRSTGGVTATEVSGNTVIDVFCTMRIGELKVRIAFDQLGRISGLYLLEP